MDPNAGNIYGWTPLHVAASLGHQKMIEALLRNGADKRIRTKDGKTPFNLFWFDIGAVMEELTGDGGRQNQS